MKLINWSVLLIILKLCFALESDENCGTVDDTEGLVIRGKQVKPHEWPWSVAIYHKIDGIKYHMICGGTLITRKKVITAAHCIHEKYSEEEKKVKDFVLKLGVYDLSRVEAHSMTIVPLRITIHPDWKPEGLRYDADIAVFELPREVAITRFIRPICIWERRRGAPMFTNGTVVGWGISDLQKNLPENIARKLSIPTVTNEQCFLEQRQFALLSSNRTFCGGAKNGQGPCKGDSGSGLFFKNDNRFYLGGIVSASALDIFKNCDVKNYAVYTDVFKFNHWLKNKKFSERLRSAVECDQYRKDRPAIQYYRDLDTVFMYNEGSPGEFPYMALLAYENETTDYVFKCNGFLLSELFVVTLAQCVVKDPLFVRLGAVSTLIRDDKNNSVALDYKIKNKLIHERFSLNLMQHDIALLELVGPVKLSYFIWPACLLNPADISKKIWIAVSRHNDEETKEYRKKFFLKFPVEEISSEGKDCQETVEMSSGNERNSTSHNQFCVKSVIQDIVLCKSSTGAPLQILGGDYYFVGGLASFINDCQLNKPVLVTRIASYLEWIEERVWPDEVVTTEPNVDAFESHLEQRSSFSFVFPSD